MLKEGVDISEVYATLQAFMGSAYINNFNRFGRQWRVYMAAAPEYRVTPDEIERFWVRSQEGSMVPLASFVSVENAVGPQFTSRFNLFRSVEVTGQAAPGIQLGPAIARSKTSRAKCSAPTTATLERALLPASDRPRARAACSCSRCSSCS